MKNHNTLTLTLAMNEQQNICKLEEHNNLKDIDEFQKTGKNYQPHVP